ncbi:MAG: Csu type fimbrial protein [Methylococcales bacterium]
MTAHTRRLTTLHASRIVLGFLVCLPGPALAILANCSVSATSVSFGAYNVFNSSPTDATGQVTVSCTGLVLSLLVSYEIQLNPGLNGSFAARKMASGANRLSYNLYLDAARTAVWGDGSSGTMTVTDGYILGLFTITRNYNVYGRIPALQNAVVGSYADTVVVTLIF